jgi:ribonuclease J
LTKGDLAIFSSRTIPGNERAVGRVQNNLALLGCDVLTDADALVHVTGHPRRDELRQMYDWIKPRILVPMHGEVRHLKEHAKLARTHGVADVIVALNGEMARLAPGPPALIDDVPVGRLYRDGSLVVPSAEGPVRERRRLSFSGIVVVSLALNRRGELVGEPQFTLDGVPQDTAEGEPMADIVEKAIDGAIRSMPPARRRDSAVLEEAVRRSVRGALADVWGKKPICHVLTTIIEART